MLRDFRHIADRTVSTRDVSLRLVKVVIGLDYERLKLGVLLPRNTLQGHAAYQRKPTLDYEILPKLIRGAALYERLSVTR